MYRRDGSITVFMAFLFLLLSALTGAVLDSARFFGSRGYVKSSSYGAQIAMYGDYNKELYEDYGLFAYGGYNGLGEKDWLDQYREILRLNLAERPEGSKRGGISSPRYASVYQLGDISVSLKKVGYLTDEDCFFRQIDAWLATTGIRDITQHLVGKVKDTGQEKQQELLDDIEKSEGLEQIADEQGEAAGNAEDTDAGGGDEKKGKDTSSGEAENGRDDKKDKKKDGKKGDGKDDKNGDGKNDKNGDGKADKKGDKKGDGKDDGKDEEKNDGKEDDGEDGDGEDGDSAREEKKKKNPLIFLKELLRDGILSLVCDEGSLEETVIVPRDTRDEDEASLDETSAVPRDARDGKDTDASGGNWYSGDSGVQILKGLLSQSDSLWSDEMMVSQKKKGKLLVYATRMFQSYVSDGDSSVPYGLEYMATGQEEQKDALAGIVNRLFLIRTLLNFLYAEGDPSLQAASLETATAIAAPLMAEALIPVIQKGILLVLSLEEACVDICALLEGRRVPVLKGQDDFKMSYPEICTANKALFQAKAKEFEKMGDSLDVSELSKGIGYIHYLWLILMMQPWQRLYQRAWDVIQYDLRERYAQTFTADRCICQTRVDVTYGIALLSGGLLAVRAGDRGDGSGKARGMAMQRISVGHGYQ